MDRFLKFVGLITIIIFIVFGANWLIQNFPKYAKPTLQVLGILALVAIFIRLYLGKDWLMKIGQEFVIGSDLITASENFLKDLPKPKDETTANLIGHLVYRFTRLGLIGLFLASIPIILLYQQNQLLSSQNERIDTQNELVIQQNELVKKQNKRLDQQTYLQEAERRSSLVFLFSNVMDAIDEELKADIGIKGKRDLSPQLIGRIVALSTRLKPYYYMDGDTLIDKPLSPERGQLLFSLVKSDLDTLTLQEIYRNADFSYADLQGMNMKGARLVEANLRHSNLQSANLEYADMRNIDLINSDLRGAKTANSDLSNASLNGVDLRRASFHRQEFNDSYLRLNRLSNSIIWNSDTNGLNLILSFVPTSDFMPNFNNARIDCSFFDRIKHYDKDSILGTSKIIEQYRLTPFGRIDSTAFCVMRKRNL